jgi:transcriptional regulator with XRE-family HTH domain
MGNFKVGDVIRKNRIELKITQEQLSEGICSVSSLSKIENNTRVPSKVVFDALMQRMDKCDALYFAYISDREFEIEEMKYKVNRLILDRQYDNASNMITKLEEIIDKNENLYNQYILYSKAIIQKNIGKDYEKVLDLLYDAIHITLPHFNKKNLSIFLLTEQDVTIINNIASVYNIVNREEEGIDLMYQLVSYIENRCKGLKFLEFLPVLLYNLSKWLGLQKRFDEAIQICDKGIEACIKYGKTLAFAEVLYNKACDLYETGRIEESKEYMKQSYYMFQAQKNYNYASFARTSAKEKFGEDIIR